MYRAERDSYSSFGDWAMDNVESFGAGGRIIEGTDGNSYGFNDKGEFGYWKVDTRSWGYDDEKGVAGVEANRDVFVVQEDPGPGYWEGVRHRIAVSFGLEKATSEELKELLNPDGSLKVAAGTVDIGPARGAKVLYQLHHSFPKFLGGLKNQKLTKMTVDAHKALHKELNIFLSKFGMAPSKINKGTDIIRNNSVEKIQKVLTDFYSGPGAKYTEAAKDFFKYLGR
jgi:hypothetical protein